VGGPAGSMEAGRQVEVATRILKAKNVPYIVAAPLLIQDIHSWIRQGIGGLQSVVLYALPELDGAIKPVPLGGLVGDDEKPTPRRVLVISFAEPDPAYDKALARLKKTSRSLKHRLPLAPNRRARSRFPIINYRVIIAPQKTGSLLTAERTL